ncbi:MAG: zf-HC2 domain-containing protein [Pyrinomonadaceae bacterium]
MNCKDFKEIADSYLSDELLVESNHDVLRHLESCPECRAELGARRELRERLRFAVKNLESSRIDAGFAMRAKSELRRQAFSNSSAWSFMGSKSILAGAFAALLVAVMAGILVQNQEAPDVVKTIDLPVNVRPNEQPIYEQASYIAARHDAIDDHENCALTHNLEENPISLDKASLIYGKANKNIDTAVMKPLRETFGDKTKLVMAHFCLINGRYFTHVVLEHQGKTVSVLLTKREDVEGPKNSDAATCHADENLRIACFESSDYSVFIISNLNEAENLTVARTISPSVKKHIEQAGV